MSNDNDPSKYTPEEANQTFNDACTKREIIKLAPSADEALRRSMPNGFAVICSTICPKHGIGFIVLADPKKKRLLSNDDARCIMEGMVAQEDALTSGHGNPLRTIKGIMDMLKGRMGFGPSDDGPDKGFDPPEPWTPESDGN